MYNLRCMGCMEEVEGTVCPHCGYIKGTPAREIYHIIPETILKGRYIVGKVLGYGGFGVTYIGWDAMLERKVAIKEFLPSDFATRMPGETIVTVYNGEATEQFGAGLQRFVEEAQRLAKFNSIGSIVDIYDTFIENNTGYIVMECLEGETIKDILQTSGVMPFESAKLIIIEILKTLEIVHKEGIIHRDISPDNIFVTKDGKIKLLDFGAARYASSYHSKSLSVILKPGYAPEEQYRSRGNQGPWSDVYATAATLYKMITGITIEESMERAVKDNVKTPIELGINISEATNNAIMNAMNIHAEKRTQSAQQFIDDLTSEDVLRVEDVPVKNDAGKLPKWLIIAGASVLTVAVIFCCLVFSGVIKIKSVYGGVVTADSSTRVPYVINKMQEEGKNLLNEDGFAMQISDQAYDENAPKDIIKFQTPEGGLLATICSEADDMGRPVVYVVVSGGHAPRFVPSVIGLTKDEAAAKLKELGFEVTYEEEYSDTEPIGRVLLQDISNVEYAYGSTIILTTSKGKMKVDKSKVHPIPSLVGMDYNEAVKKLTAIGMYAKKVEKADSKKEGTVLSQSVENGKECKEGTTITLTVSTNTIVIPDVTYKEEGTAKSMLTAVGVNVKVKYEKSRDVKAGNVISQDKKGKSTQGTTVTITVSTGFDETIEKKSINIPDVKGKTLDAAKSAITKAGGKVGSVTEEYSDKAKGTVIGQSNVGACKEGTVINLAVSKGKEPENEEKSKNINIPDVRGKTLDDAKSAIKKAGGKVGSVSEEYSDKKKGVVTSQSVKGEAKDGVTVNLIVSKGEKPKEIKKINIPDVRGKSLDSAKSAITKAGGKVGTVIEEYNSKSKGTVLTQSVKGEASEGVTVNLTVSKGEKPKEIKKVNIPDVKGKSLDSAKSAIRNAGGQVGAITEEYNNSVAKGLVISQNKKGSQDEGTVITLIVSKGEKPKEVKKINIPDVRGRSHADAKFIITQAGGKVAYNTDEYSNTVPDGDVISQSIKGECDEGTVVYLTVSKGPTMINIPVVRDKTLDAAKTAIIKAGGKIGNVSENYSNEPKGIVIGQSVTGKCAEGTTVNLSVSKGRDPASTTTIIPNCTGKSLNTAKKEIANATGNVLVVGEYSTVAQGLVIKQSVSGECDKGEEVVIYVSEGPTPAWVQRKYVPNLVGKTASDAKKALKAEGLKLGATVSEYSNKEKGTVIRQSITSTGDDEVAVNIVVSKGRK